MNAMPRTWIMVGSQHSDPKNSNSLEPNSVSVGRVCYPPGCRKTGAQHSNLFFEVFHSVWIVKRMQYILIGISGCLWSVSTEDFSWSFLAQGSRFLSAPFHFSSSFRESFNLVSIWLCFSTRIHQDPVSFFTCHFNLIAVFFGGMLNSMPSLQPATHIWPIEI